MVKFRTTRFASKKFAPIKWLFIILSMVFLAIGSYFSYSRYQLVEKQLFKLGWVTELKTQRQQFSLECLKNSDCRGQMLKGMTGSHLGYFAPFMIFGMIAYWFAMFEAPRYTNKPTGMAHWATNANIKDWLKKSPKNSGYIGMTKTGQILSQERNERNEGLAIIGKPGARKTTGVLRPMLYRDIQDNASIAIIDIKSGEAEGGLMESIAWATAKGMPCHLFTPYFGASKVLPILRGGDDPDNALEIAQIINAKKAGESGDAGHHRAVGTVVLSNLIAFHVRHGKGSVREILRFIDNTGYDPELFMTSIMQLTENQRIMGIGPFNQLSKAKQAEVLMGLSARLQIWADSRLDHATRLTQDSNEIMPMDKLGLEPGVFYFGIPQNKSRLESGRGMLRLIFQQINRWFEINAAKSGGKLKIPSVWVLDELMNFGHLGDDLGEMFNTIRGRGVAVSAVFQNLAYGEALYGESTFKGFFESIGTKIWFPAKLANQDLVYLSDALGNTTGMEKRKTKSSGNGKSSRSESRVEVSRPLLAREEAMHFPLELGVIQSSRPPVQILLPRLDEKMVKGIKNPLNLPYSKNLYGGDLTILARTLAGTRLTVEQEVMVQTNLETNELERFIQIALHQEATIAYSDTGISIQCETDEFFNVNEEFLIIEGNSFTLTDDGLACLPSEIQEAVLWLADHGQLLEEAKKDGRIKDRAILIGDEDAKAASIGTSDLEKTKRAGKTMYYLPIPVGIKAVA
jgi:type IV secretory pathway TraG/TraD family ATPase VirD4